jgi:hypothetical protein
MIYTENPLHVEIVQTLVPVANEVLDEVRIEVRAEEVVDPKREENPEQTEPSLKKRCEKILDYMYIGFLILVLLGFLGGFILLLVWMTQPNLFGTQPENY